MSTTLVRHELETPPDLDRGGRGFDRGDGGGDGDGRGGRSSPRYDTYRTAAWVLLVPVVMLFVGLTSALVVRSGISGDWVAVEVPPLLFLNTLVLVGSSLTLEASRRSLVGASEEKLRRWLSLTAALGILFLAGQLVAWKQLASQGIFVGTNPGSSFFYVLTGAHGAHLVGGLAAILYLVLRVVRNELTPRRRSALGATAVYWHFMDVLWIYLLSLLILWR